MPERYGNWNSVFVRFTRSYTLLCIYKSSRQASNLPCGMWQMGHTVQAMWIGLTESRSAGGTEQTAGMLSGHLFGPGGNTTPEDIGSMGGEYGPLRRRHSGKGRAVPGRCPSIPVVPSFAALNPFYGADR
jgi:hypothetical protein